MKCVFGVWGRMLSVNEILPHFYLVSVVQLCIVLTLNTTFNLDISHSNWSTVERVFALQKVKTY